MTWRKKGGGKGVEVEGLRGGGGGGGGCREGERRRRWLRDGEASKLVREEGGGVERLPNGIAENNSCLLFQSKWTRR